MSQRKRKPRRPNVRKGRIADPQPDPSEPQKLAEEADHDFDCSDTGCAPCAAEHELTEE